MRFIQHVEMCARNFARFNMGGNTSPAAAWLAVYLRCSVARPVGRDLPDIPPTARHGLRYPRTMKRVILFAALTMAAATAWLLAQSPSGDPLIDGLRTV